MEPTTIKTIYIYCPRFLINLVIFLCVLYINANNWVVLNKMKS